VAYLYEKRRQTPPSWVLGLFVFATVVVWALTFQDSRDYMAIAAQLAFVAAIAARHENTLRVFMMINMLAWLGYNFSVQAYTPVIGNAFFVVSDAVALLRYRHRSHQKNQQRS
jgi:hypothetical protein